MAAETSLLSRCLLALKHLEHQHAEPKRKHCNFLHSRINSRFEKKHLSSANPTSGSESDRL
jgi:hypothetical protein